eukprot:1744715-Pleurochrysis_carterae.AAC.1
MHTQKTLGAFFAKLRLSTASTFNLPILLTSMGSQPYIIGPRGRYPPGTWRVEASGKRAYPQGGEHGRVTAAGRGRRTTAYVRASQRGRAKAW